MLTLFKPDQHKRIKQIWEIPSSANIDHLYCYWENNKTLLFSDKYETLSNLNTDNFTTRTICSGSKIYFSPDSLISPLFLSKLKAFNIDIKRVTKPEKADIIVCSKRNPISSNCISITSEYNEDNVRIQYTTYDSNDKNEETKQALQQVFGKSFYFVAAAYNNDLANKAYLMDTYPDKIVFDQDLMKYLFQFLPTIDDEAFDNVIQMLSNSEESVRNLGYNCLQYYNFSNRLFDLLWFMKKRRRYNCTTLSKASSAQKLISVVLNDSLEYEYCYAGYYDLKNYVNQVIENPLNTQSMDTIAQKIVTQYCNDIESEDSYVNIKNALRLIGYTIKLEKLPDDQNGETESGN